MTYTANVSPPHSGRKSNHTRRKGLRGWSTFVYTKIGIRQRLPVDNKDDRDKSGNIQSVTQPMSGNRGDYLSERDRKRERMPNTPLSTLKKLCYLWLHLFGESWLFTLEATLIGSSEVTGLLSFHQDAPTANSQQFKLLPLSNWNHQAGDDLLPQ